MTRRHFPAILAVAPSLFLGGCWLDGAPLAPTLPEGAVVVELARNLGRSREGVFHIGTLSVPPGTPPIAGLTVRFEGFVGPGRKWCLDSGARDLGAEMDFSIPLEDLHALWSCGTVIEGGSFVVDVPVRWFQAVPPDERLAAPPWERLRKPLPFSIRAGSPGLIAICSETEPPWVTLTSVSLILHTEVAP